MLTNINLLHVANYFKIQSLSKMLNLIEFNIFTDENDQY